MISSSSALLVVVLFYSQFSAYETGAVCCPAGGIWSDWTDDLTTCYDYCGGAGTMNRIRFCISESQGCPCTGNATEVAPCDNTPCIYPRNWTCSPNKTLSGAGGRFQCLAAGESGVQNTTLPPAPACESCPPAGIWGEWKDAGSCSDTCGACGKINRTRNCLSAPYGCRCTGNIWELQNCARTPCVGRSSECCLSSTLTTVNGTALCVDNFAPTPIVVKRQATPCISPWGLWNDWSSWSTCSATCGLCGTRTRTRTCGSDPYGCPCTGFPNQTQLCGNNGCPGATPCCGGTYNLTTYDGATICMAVKTVLLPTPGAWTPYTPLNGKTCNDTCGGFGTVSSYRFCLPVGSGCSGNFYTPAPCNLSICQYPRSSCAPGFAKAMNTTSQTFYCNQTITNS